MPLFVRSKLLFIHIPKTGGTSIEKLLEERGEAMSMFTSTGSIFINGHTPQHCTFRELQDLNMVTDEVRIFTVVRNPVDRTISEYFYLKRHRPDIDELYRGFDGFLDLFLNSRNNAFFDNHNLSNVEYLIDHAGLISDRVTIFNYFDVRGIEAFIGCEGLGRLNYYKTERASFQPDDRQLKRIRKYFREDFKYFDYDL